jgi:hypothetical protein
MQVSCLLYGLLNVLGIFVCIHNSFSFVCVVVAVLSANTDTRHYLSLSSNIYRFAPVLISPDDLPRYHGINERISVKNYEQLINFYSHLMSNADKASLISDNIHPSHSSDL